MSVYPDLASYGYQILAELGRNREGGRITWQAKNITTRQTVVIKQFCFAIANSSWSGYKAYEQELAVLQKLHHPGIPQYLDSIETPDGFCLVQEYIPAENLNSFRKLTVSEVKQVALKIFDILIYLQQQSPPILHRDIKPENILITASLEVYLIDFGFASLGSEEVSGSSVFKGTPGFIAPEQMNRPTLASDNYSLGVTLVCLLSDKNISEIRTLTTEDEPYRLPLKSILPNLEAPFVSWLEKMIETKVSKRFPNALTAKNSLIELDSITVDDKIVPAIDSKLAALMRPKIWSGTAIIFALSAIALPCVNFAYSRTELSAVNIAIALFATAAVGIAQSGAVAIASWDREARTQGAILNTVMPIILVAASGLIWGVGEAIDICATIAITEVALFSYHWWQIPSQKSNVVKTSIWLGAIASSIAFIKII